MKGIHIDSGRVPSNGSTAPGYLSTPTSGSGIPVVVLQEYWGLEDHIRDVSDRLAAEGFVALSPVDDAKALEQEMKDAGVDTRFEFYDGKGHAFFNDTNRLGTYDADAARESWVKALDFLRSNLT